MHSHANRAGYLDLGGCTIGDMLLRFVIFAIPRSKLSVADRITVTSSQHALNARLPIRHLAYLQFVAKAPCQYVASAIAKWVGFNTSCLSISH